MTFGTLYFSDWRQTCSDWGWTPATAVDDRHLMVAPEARRGGGPDRDAALLLLDHEVHRGGAVVHLAELVVLAGVVQDALRRGGLAAVDVGHDADVAVLFQRDLACHVGSSWVVRRAGRRVRGGCVGNEFWKNARDTTTNGAIPSSLFRLTSPPSLCYPSAPLPRNPLRSVAQTGSAFGSGPKGQEFKSLHSDHLKTPGKQPFSRGFVFPSRRRGATPRCGASAAARA